jgi:Ulp1 family protease
MGLSPDKEILSHINNFIHHRLEDRYKWIVEVQKNNQKQTNGDDCGVFVCLVRTVRRSYRLLFGIDESQSLH